MLTDPSNDDQRTAFQRATEILRGDLLTYLDHFERLAASDPNLGEELHFHADVQLEQLRLTLDPTRLRPRIGTSARSVRDDRPSLQLLPGGAGKR
jgi:hypothetical protein